MPEETRLDVVRTSLENLFARSSAEARVRLGRVSASLADARSQGRVASAGVNSLTRERIDATRALSGETADAIDALLVARSLEDTRGSERDRLLRSWLPYLSAVATGHFAPNPAALDPDMDGRSSGLRPLWASMRDYFRVGAFWCERNGIPRRWIVQAAGSQRIRLAQYVAVRLGGFKPIWQTHLPKQPLGVHLTRELFVRSHLEIARALRRQEHIRGIASSSWYYDPEIAAVSPNLSFIREILAPNGCFVFEIPCDEPMRQNAIYANRERQQAVAEGRYTPRAFARLWSRDTFLRWAERQPGWQMELALTA